MASVKVTILLPAETTELVKTFKKLGFEFKGQTGSHMKFSRPNTPGCLVIKADVREQSMGTLRNVARLIPELNYYEQDAVETLEWTAFSKEFTAANGLPKGSGMFNGMVMCEASAQGAIEFMNKLNSKIA